jgi:hypothetical protein
LKPVCPNAVWLGAIIRKKAIQALIILARRRPSSLEVETDEIYDRDMERKGRKLHAAHQQRNLRTSLKNSSAFPPASQNLRLN